TLGQRLDRARLDRAADLSEVMQEGAASDALSQLQLAGQVTDATTQRRTGTPRYRAEHRQLASGRADDVHQHPQHGRLARTIRADQPEHRTLFDAQADPIDGEVLSVLLLQLACLNNSGHASSFPSPGAVLPCSARALRAAANSPVFA